MSYIKLEAGAVRHPTDEVRKIDLGPGGYDCHGTMDTYHCSGRSATRCVHWHEPREIKPGPWEPVQLIGHAILESDLMIAEFRREIAVD
jgi:hypothetical protein